MKKAYYITLLCGFFLLLANGWSCKEPFTSPVIEGDNSYLVIDGIINSGQDSTIITLSRTRNLNDTSSFIPELNASVSVQEENGASYTLQSIGGGRYGIEVLTLNPSSNCRLRIRTANGSEYASAYVPIKSTPPIDSLNWDRPDGHDVLVYANTHDPNNNTRYYRWSFSETWEYRSYFDTNLGYNRTTGQIYYRDSSALLTQCWSTANSTSVVVGTSASISEDIIQHQTVARVPEGSMKLSYRYSILVKQYALTKEAFEYWQLLRKTSEQQGTLFDPQPSQIFGNIFCLTNPNEPVIGYMSASSVEQKRLFITRSEVPGWDQQPPPEFCPASIIPTDSAIYYFRDTSLAPAYYVGMGGFAIAIAKNKCVDCTWWGGNTKKPSFW